MCVCRPVHVIDCQRLCSVAYGALEMRLLLLLLLANFILAVLIAAQHLPTFYIALPCDGMHSVVPAVDHLPYVTRVLC